MWPTRICREGIDRHLKYWFGRSDFTDKRLVELRDALIDAIKEVDVIGYYHGDGRNKYHRYSKTFVEKRGLCDGKIITCGAIHRQLWTSNAIDQLIEQASQVALVTCRDVMERFEQRYHKLPSIITIPEEANTGHQATDHCSKFDEYRNLISTLASPGDLWLIGAGLLGKMYTIDAAKAGAVVLDVGSLFDGWAGVKSRSYLADNNYRLRNKERDG